MRSRILPGGRVPKMYGRLPTGQGFPSRARAWKRNFGGVHIVAEWEAVPDGAAVTSTLLERL